MLQSEKRCGGGLAKKGCPPCGLAEEVSVEREW